MRSTFPAIICALELLLYPFSVAFDARGRGSLLLPAWPGVDICRYRELSPMPASAVTLPCVKLPLDARMSAWGIAKGHDLRSQCCSQGPPASFAHQCRCRAPTKSTSATIPPKLRKIIQTRLHKDCTTKN